MTTQRVAALVAARQFERAIREATTALATDPESARLWHLLALAQYGSGDHRAALESIERVFAAGPPGADVLVHRGWILSALDRPGEAVTTFEAALAVAPEHAEAHACLARSLVAGGDETASPVRARALEHARRACELAPGSPRVHLALATVLLAGPAGAGARRAAEPVRAAIALEPGNAEALQLQALVDLRCRHAVRAVRGYSEVLRLDPQNAVAARNLALAAWLLFARAHFVVLGLLVTALVVVFAAPALGSPGGPVVRGVGAALIAVAAWFVLVSRPRRAFPPAMRPAAKRLLRRDELVRPYLAGIAWAAACGLAAVVPWEGTLVGRVWVLAGLFGYGIGAGAARKRLQDLSDRNELLRHQAWLEVAATLRRD
ncbi:tetratricopeptide repeat protein [Amycolatopsis sp. NPDC004747]